MPIEHHSGVGPDILRQQQPDVLPRLLHEVRQPLCGIESIAYYLEMATDDQEEAIRHQCGKLRAMVRHASWLLDDAALGVPAPDASAPTAHPKRVIFDIAERLALHEERPLDLRLSEESPSVRIAESRLRRMIEHVLCFFHEVAETDEPVRIWSRQEDASYAVCLAGHVGSERSQELVALFGTLRPGGLAGALSSIGGALEVASAGDVVEIVLDLPAAAHD